jgi:hypothetical protein
LGRRTVWVLIVIIVLASGLGAWVTLRARAEPPWGAVHEHREIGPRAVRLASGRFIPMAPRVRAQRARDVLFAELQPVKVTNCELARYGEPHDGGYMACRNLLSNVRSAYSYGISGYDGWGCAIATELTVPVHQYDCFNVTEPVCSTGRTIFHPECVAATHSRDADGRLFDSMAAQFAKNGDAGKHVIVKMDVEGAEWDSMLKTPDAVFEKIDQMIFELHGVDDNIARSLEVVFKLKKHFQVAHFHINNFSCLHGIQPFGGWAYEVTLVNKRLAQVDPNGKVALPSPLDTPNNPGAPDCQTVPGPIR